MVDLSRVDSVLSHMIEHLQEKIAQPLPDWVNSHDFQSGRAVERRKAVMEQETMLRYVRWWLEQVDK